ncbi:MAG: hypothetical protein ACOH10_10385 [Rhodoglobus sp.]
MSPVAHESVYFDVHDFKVYPMLTDVSGGSPTYGAAVDVPGISDVSLDPNLVTAELKGDAKILAKKGRIDKVAMKATYGKLSLDVLKVVMEGTLTDATTVSAKFAVKGTNSLPYFKAAFTIDDVDLGLGSLQATLHKAQITGGTLITSQTDQFGQPSMDIEGIACASNDALFDVEFFTAKTPLPA